MAVQNPINQYNEFTPQVQGLERQRKMAEMLMQQGINQPQGQMVSGHFVAPSWTQNLAGLANIWAGKSMQEEADKAQLGLAQQYRQAGQQELADFLRAKEGTPESERVYASEAGPARDIIPAQAPMDKLALALKASQAQYNPMLPALGAKLLEQQFREPKWEKAELPQPDGSVKTGWVDVNSAQPELTFRSGGTKPSISPTEAMKGAYEGWYPGGAVQGGQGNQVTQGGGAKVAPTFTPTGGQKEFYGSIYNTALQQAKAMGAPNPEALATLAATQSSIETGSGKHLAGGNNYFGIKGGNNPQKTQEFDPTTGTFKTVTSSFRQYGDMNQSVGDYLNLLKNNYPLAFNAKSPEEAFVGITSKNPQGLKYMTDPNYLGKLQAYNASLGGGTTPNSINLGGQVIQGASNPTQPGYQVASTGNVVAPTGILPKDVPQYQYDSSLSPKLNQEARAKFNADIQAQMKNAQNSVGIIKTASDILSSNAPSSGRGENIITGAREFFGGGGQASKADAQLKLLGERLTMMQPRFEGPQSDKDTASYRAAAGDVGNPNIPIQSRLASLQEMVNLNKKYYPSGEWDKIDLSGPLKTKQTFFSGEKTINPTQFRETLKGVDAEAFDWARKNPSDPRASQIMDRLGVK